MFNGIRLFSTIVFKSRIPEFLATVGQLLLVIFIICLNRMFSNEIFKTYDYITPDIYMMLQLKHLNCNT